MMSRSLLRSTILLTLISGTTLFASDDKAKRDEVEARNQLDSMVYQIEKMLKEHGEKISGGERTEVESALADAKKALEGTDATAMNSARERLTKASHKLAEAMYKSAQPSGGAQAGGFPGSGTTGDGASSPQEQKKDEGVIDAEYVDVEPKR